MFKKVAGWLCVAVSITTFAYVANGLTTDKWPHSEGIQHYVDRLNIQNKVRTGEIKPEDVPKLSDDENAKLNRNFAKNVIEIVLIVGLSGVFAFFLLLPSKYQSGN